MSGKGDAINAFQKGLATKETRRTQDSILGHKPGEVIPVRGPGLPDGVQSTSSYGLDDPSLTPEQILRMSIRYASQCGDLAAIATLASALHQVIGGSK